MLSEIARADELEGVIRFALADGVDGAQVDLVAIATRET